MPHRESQRPDRHPSRSDIEFIGWGRSDEPRVVVRVIEDGATVGLTHEECVERARAFMRAEARRKRAEAYVAMETPEAVPVTLGEAARACPCVRRAADEETVRVIGSRN